MSVEALLQQVLAVEPFHPAHHYRIHLWDSKDSAERVVDTAVRCGPSWPGIAHNWHMGGHIFAQLGRHYDAAWQQEASARVDHAHMQRAWLLPDEIHNFAHNNEWLTRSLRHQGRVTESVELAKNMIELPRHPDLNSLEKRRCGDLRPPAPARDPDRLRAVGDAPQLGETMYLEPHLLDPRGAAGLLHGPRRGAPGGRRRRGPLIEQLESMLVSLKAERSEAVNEAEEEALAADKERDEVRAAMAKAMESFEREASTIRKQIDALEALADHARGEDPIAALEALKDASYDRVHLARMMAESGDDGLTKEGLKMARGLAKEAMASCWSRPPRPTSFGSPASRRRPSRSSRISGRAPPWPRSSSPPSSVSPPSPRPWGSPPIGAPNSARRTTWPCAWTSTSRSSGPATGPPPSPPTGPSPTPTVTRSPSRTSPAARCSW